MIKNSKGRSKVKSGKQMLAVISIAFSTNF